MQQLSAGWWDEEREPVTAATRSVAIVDDDADLFEIVKYCYEESRLPAELYLFEGGKAFLEFVEQARADASMPLPGLVLLDVNMPGCDGFEVLDDLRAKLADAERPLVCMLSGSDAERDLLRAKDAGASGYWVKPSSLDGYISLFKNLADSLE